MPKPPREGGGPNPPYGEDFWQRIVNVHWRGATGATGPGPPGVLYIWFRVCPDGDWNGDPAADPVTGVGGIDLTPLVGALFPIFTVIAASPNSATVNFGADLLLKPFAGEVPDGFITKPSATWNPEDKTALMTLSDDKLTATADVGFGGIFEGTRATMSFSTGEKWYWEVTMTLWEDGTRVGVALASAGLGSIFTSDEIVLFLNGSIAMNLFPPPGAPGLGPRASGDVIGIAMREVTVPAST